MDFTLALTHFCEVHGPKSVLCTQVLPLECASCSRFLPTRAFNSSKSFSRRGKVKPPAKHAIEYSSEDGESSAKNVSHRERRDSELNSIEQHPLFKASDCLEETSKFPYGRTHGETCASCTFTVPSTVAAQLPAGAPGSLPKDGSKSKYGAPVLRSRETVCLGGRKETKVDAQTGSSEESQLSSSGSLSSVNTTSDCHDHTITYLTAKSPDDPEDYADLRASVIRALSCEVLPRGMSEGPICFGDANTGYTIAYVFRLTDPEARGKRRAYAFVALAGKDSNKAFKACPLLWEAFAAMSQTIEQAAQRAQDEQDLTHSHNKADDSPSKSQKPAFTEPSSFLTKRPRDNNGQFRGMKQTQPRSLAEIIDNENIFSILHSFFVKVLRCLGQKFGGMPITSTSPTSRPSPLQEKSSTEDKFPSRVSTDILATLQLNDEEEAGVDSKLVNYRH